ncbi:hypothetical protein SAY86_010283 [Trapa natans]|uniref:Thaumatin-like protein 1b n=1 Tax=Trapa natans TaxID=22666 RepID=A0AAN7KSC1_TRANT|nr:hypothetical protein SAY86_010283 [Trapa natans]
MAKHSGCSLFFPVTESQREQAAGMDPSPRHPYLLSILTVFTLLCTSQGATFTFVNRCEYTVWPGILANAGSPRLGSTGFELQKGSSRSFQAPTGWSGRFWGRTGCKFDGSGSGTCQTADCGSGQVECNGLGAAPPATLAEFTLGTGGQDFYDVSLVDGYNLQMVVEPSNGLGDCTTTGCLADLNQQCPTELKAEGGSACKSACGAFGSPEYCCSGAYSTPATCRPTIYSEMFKAACPRSYSYAYDDATSTFTCSGADYTVTFCPSSPSQKSSWDYPAPAAASTTTTSSATSQDSGASIEASNPGSGSQFVYNSSSGLDFGSGFSDLGSVDDVGSSEDGTGALLGDTSWLAGLAMENSATMTKSSSLFALLLSTVTLWFPLLYRW